MRALASLTLLFAFACSDKEATDDATTDGTTTGDEGGDDGSGDGGGDGSGDDGSGDDGSGDDGSGDDGGEDGGGDDEGGDDGGEAAYGPDNDWPHASASDVPSDLAGTGRDRGDVLPNFTVVDQNGDDVELYQFYGYVVQLVLFAEWCGPCQAEAPDIEQASRDLAADGVVVLGVMMEDEFGGTPGADALDRWVTRFDITHPLVAGPSDLGPSIQGGYPTLPVLDRDMTIATVDNFPFDAGYLASLAAD